MYRYFSFSFRTNLGEIFLPITRIDDVTNVKYIRVFVIGDQLSHPLVLGPSALLELGIELFDTIRNKSIEFSPLLPEQISRPTTTIFTNATKNLEQVPEPNREQHTKASKPKKRSQRKTSTTKPKKEQKPPMIKRATVSTNTTSTLQPATTIPIVSSHKKLENHPELQQTRSHYKVGNEVMLKLPNHLESKFGHNTYGPYTILKVFKSSARIGNIYDKSQQLVVPTERLVTTNSLLHRNSGNYPSSLSNNDPKSRNTIATPLKDRNNENWKRSLQMSLH